MESSAYQSEKSDSIDESGLTEDAAVKDEGRLLTAAGLRVLVTSILKAVDEVDHLNVHDISAVQAQVKLLEVELTRRGVI